MRELPTPAYVVNEPESRGIEWLGFKGDSGDHSPDISRGAVGMRTKVAGKRAAFAF